MNILWSVLLLVVIIACGGKANSELTNIDFDEIRYMNLSADPCENFYEYTCGNFKNIYPLEDGDLLLDQFNLLEDKLALVVHDILTTEINEADPDALNKAKGAYYACMDNDFHDSIQMINPEVNVIGKYKGFPIIGQTNEEIIESTEPFGWNDIGDLAAEFGISIFFTPSLTYDNLNASRNLLWISVDGMEIPVQFRPTASQSYEDAIEEGFIQMAQAQNKSNNGRLRSATISSMELLFRKMVLKLKRVLGSNRSDAYIFDRVANISNFLIGIYHGGWIPNGTVISPIVNDTNASTVTLKELNNWTIKHFGNTVQLDWVEYVKRLLQYTYVEVNEDFLILRPNGLENFIYGVLNWVRMNDEEIVKSAALLRAFTYMAPDSDSETRDYFEEYLRATKKTILPRWKYCTRKLMDVTGTLSLGVAVTYEYQLKHFSQAKRENALSLINNLQSTFKQIIEETNWMDDESKEAAQSKAKNIITLLAYPEFINNPETLDYFYENLQITTWNHFENAKNIRAFQQAYTLNMIKTRNRKTWEKSPFVANAYYNRQNNRIIFPIAMLNHIFFEGSANILDYSRIGMIIAHEITHGFDRQGFLYNPEGVIEPWWSNETIVNFRNNSQCFVDQYASYFIPEINGTISGTGSLNENLADNGGLRTAYRAFKEKILSTVRKSYPVLLGSKEFTAEQMFFVGYGTMWCSSESISYLKSLQTSCETTSTCHARSQMRVNGVVSNMEEFAEAFNCPAGSPMNPDTKCRLW
ncbi:unnamed protein product [Ceutorhynchus assimilis]|uniref:Uncharacterized protein n=1 Tax=Ceutorhynchus assimilis TaxID=467358 RepID=A0A9N9N105_9CUCU|nr:unnamed protein product [Ceutorhynchus assimilis]